MQRRQFIKHTLGGLSVAAAGSSLAGGSAGERKHADSNGTDLYDTVVIGGGFAGVTAARDASQMGLRTLLLEARPRLGGRTFTTRFGGHDIDAGGTWLGWGQPHVWSECMRYGMEIDMSASTGAEQFVWYHGRERMEGNGAEYGRLSTEAFEKFFAPAREMFPHPYEPLLQSQSRQFQQLDQMSAAEAIEKLDLSDVQKTLARSLAAINGHAPATESSYLDHLRWIALGGFDQAFMWSNLGYYRLKGGTRALLEKMQGDSRAELRLGTVVRSVSQQAGGVSIVTGRGEHIRARTVIFALPLNVLSQIQFEPTISHVKLDASQQGHTGSGSKVYMRIKGKHPVIFAQGREDMAFNFYWTEYDDGDSQITVGFNASPDYLDVNDDEEIQKAVHLFQPGVELLESFSYDWNLDPFSKGTWCMYPPGMLTGALQELQRPEGNLYFAGADIANGWRGFIDGAIETGARAARLVGERLIPEELAGVSSPSAKSA
ncbi:FAD-dependent oxidoreductase [Pseudomaricurvus alkylphenolicus]|uniref:flavin monoamine oxidase family protein n=1 Tax=Pseudomaricurvus alkylphenolicus TaxID=1306991 RepID=UPI001421F6F4|nr:NAD(P)/FAD-dependent oxidoreductase [Pseudomaricurvus alkylphenolicus]NIB40420.1 FAD-dependent oxidoreductase [Pseudomaricurvus alkylphenolicus]